MGAINVLTFHGIDGIQDITDIIELPDSDAFVKQYGLNAIAWFRALNKSR